ncbi:cytochrome c550 [Oceanobacillus halotolerans]|uniref:cytochrome c550 n=1 Tax=Oceanobacillus halotolerans TaxID=2663380 RepID=UPI0013D9E03E|nr:cytochrome c [Oceanobacillus halotolerans]
MKRNPVIPYAIIALIGILLVIGVSFIGLDQRDTLQNEEEGGAEQQDDAQEGETADDPEAIYESNCASCHGGDLSGGGGPALTEVGSNRSKDEIQDIIINGTDGGMPAGMATNEEAEVLADWLSEMK